MTIKILSFVAIILVVWGIVFAKPIIHFLGVAWSLWKGGDRLVRGLPSGRPGIAKRFWQWLVHVWGWCRKYVDKYVLLQTYEDSLLDQKINFYLALYGIFILAMALLEASAWSYLGFLFGHEGAMRWFCAGIVFLLVFVLVWGMDVCLAIYDGLAERMSREFGIPYLHNGPGLKLAIPVRMAMLAASLIIAAPLLANIVFRADIEAELRSQGAAAIALKREQIGQKHEDNFKTIDMAIASLQRRLDQTLIGKGGHPGIGCGVECRNLKEQIAAKQTERQAEVVLAQNELTTFNHDSGNWQSDPEALHVKWNVTVPRLSVLESETTMKLLEKRSEYHHVEWAIRFLFLLAFASVVICKLFESHAASLYGNSILQGLYRQLPPNRPISAEQFYRLMLSEGKRKRWEDLVDLKAREPELVEAVRVRRAAADASGAAYETALTLLEKHSARRQLQHKKVGRCIEDAKTISAEPDASATELIAFTKLRNTQEAEEEKLVLLETEILALARSVEKTKCECDSVNADLAHYAARLNELRQKIAIAESELTRNDLRGQHR